MGVAGSCEDLQQHMNACYIYNCVTDVKGIASRSASPSDQWILTLADGTNYGGEPVKKAFMKYWPNNRIEQGSDIFKMSSRMLDYEVKIYKEVVRHLIDHNVCPNFIKYYSSSANCSTGSLIEMLTRKAKIEGTDQIMNDENAIKVVVRNLNYMLKHAENRPSINDIGIDYLEGTVGVKKHWSFNVIINEAVTENTIDLRTWIYRTIRANNGKHHTNIWKVMFQVAAACYAMSLSRMVHNDLHAGNIWVEELPEEHEVIYIYNNIMYKFNTKYKALLYDFDRSYAERLGFNITMWQELCDKYNQCNSVVNNKDIVKIFGYLYHMSYEDQDKNNILAVVAETEQGQKNLEVVYDTGVLLQVGERAVTEEELFDQCRSPQGVLDIMGIAIPEIERVEGDSGERGDNIFVCRPDMFDIDGSLILISEDKLNVAVEETQDMARHAILAKQQDIDTCIEEREQLIEDYESKLDESFNERSAVSRRCEARINEKDEVIRNISRNFDMEVENQVKQQVDDLRYQHYLDEELSRKEIRRLMNEIDRLSS